MENNKVLVGQTSQVIEKSISDFYYIDIND